MVSLTENYKFLPENRFAIQKILASGCIASVREQAFNQKISRASEWLQEKMPNGAENESDKLLQAVEVEKTTVGEKYKIRIPKSYFGGKLGGFIPGETLLVILESVVLADTEIGREETLLAPAINLRGKWTLKISLEEESSLQYEGEINLDIPLVGRIFETKILEVLQKLWNFDAQALITEASSIT